jgi:hypothetical protein
MRAKRKKNLTDNVNYQSGWFGSSAGNRMFPKMPSDNSHLISFRFLKSSRKKSKEFFLSDVF